MLRTVMGVWEMKIQGSRNDAGALKMSEAG